MIPGTRGTGASAETRYAVGCKQPTRRRELRRKRRATVKMIRANLEIRHGDYATEFRFRQGLETLLGEELETLLGGR